VRIQPPARTTWLSRRLTLKTSRLSPLLKRTTSCAATSKYSSTSNLPRPTMRSALRPFNSSAKSAVSTSRPRRTKQRSKLQSRKLRWSRGGYSIRSKRPLRPRTGKKRPLRPKPAPSLVSATDLATPTSSSRE